MSEGGNAECDMSGLGSEAEDEHSYDHTHMWSLEKLQRRPRDLAEDTKRVGEKRSIHKKQMMEHVQFIDGLLGEVEEAEHKAQPVKSTDVHKTAERSHEVNLHQS